MATSEEAPPKSLFAGALAVLPKMKGPGADGKDVILAKPFIEACKEVVPIVDVFGPAMAIVKSDISGNIERLKKALAADPEKYKDLYTFVKEEHTEGTATGRYSNTQAVLWLTRAMDFLLMLLKKLEDDEKCSVKEAADSAYAATLSPYHNWLARSAFTVAMQFCPSREGFFQKLGTGYHSADLQLVLSSFLPMLKENHEFLESLGYDKLVAM